jgi:5,10-methylenetetrahydromethanopterin reductase
LKFGFSHRPLQPYTRSVELVKVGERLGYDYAFQPDQTYRQDPWVVLTACALATQRITLGLAVTNPYTRHPALIARAAGVLDEVAGGRFVLGLGAANRKQVLEPLGFDTSGTAKRLKEAVLVLRRLFAGERVEYASPTLTVRGIQLEFKTRPNIPIFVASRAPLTMAVAGEVADGVFMETLLTPSALAWALDSLRKGAQRAGREPGSIETVCHQMLLVTSDMDTTLPRIAHMIAHTIGSMPAEVAHTIGIRPEVVAAIKLSYAEGGPEGAAPHVTEEEVARLSLVGTPPQLIQRLEAMRDHGVQSVSLLLLTPFISYEEAADTLTRFAQDVMPRFR